MFSGLISRCKTPLLCAAASAEPTCKAMSRHARRSNFPRARSGTQRLAFDEFGRDKVPAPVNADLVNNQNVGMIQGGSCARFGFEPAQLPLVGRDLLRQKLECDLAAEQFVSRQIDFTHAADADERLDPIVTNQLTE